MVVTHQELTKAQLETFHKKCRQLCGTRASFDKNFEIDRGHVVLRASQTGDSWRYALMDPERVAAVIKGGALNLGNSSAGPPLEIAVEAYFSEVAYVDLASTTAPIGERTIQDVCVRVVVRERTRRNVVVTVYWDNTLNKNDLPEVQNEIW